jgi:hypothetical protein
MYRQDPNDSTKLSPVGRPKDFFAQVKAPAQNVVTTSPAQVLINNTGSYYFMYGTGSLGTTHSNKADYDLGCVINAGSAGLPVKLDISPMAWSGSAGGHKTGDISFVYRGG